MKPQHHLDTATLVSYAAGALPEALAVVAATHLGVCRHCREQLHDAESVGGQLLAQQAPVAIEPTRLSELRTAMLEQLEHAAPATSPKAADAGATGTPADPDRLPAPLHPYFGTSYRALRWRWVAPGVRYLRAAGVDDAKLIMLKIAPGKSMPVHSHGGTEITQILQGAYDDALGHYAAGDIADLDSEVEHQPVTSPGVPCICVAALDAPLRFPGWLARALQPLVGL
jgi:putative transcriptional regulator